MIVKAKSLDGKIVYGMGFSPSTEPNFEGHEVSILFHNYVDWRDGSELGCSDFEFIFTDSVELIEDDSSLKFNY